MVDAQGSRARLMVSVALGVIGLGIATYLTIVHYAGGHPLCLSGGGGCETVQKSDWSKLAGVPVALMGLVTYVAILATLAVRGEMARAATLTLTLIGFGFSAYLTYRELFTIDAICQWCVGSAVVMTLLLIASAWAFLSGDR